MIKPLHFVFLCLTFFSFNVLADIATTGPAALAFVGVGMSALYIGAAVAGGAVTAMTLATAAPVLAIGALLLIEFDGSKPVSSSSAPLVIQLNPNTPLTTPSGWVAPVPPSIQPTPPPSVAPSSTYQGNNNPNYSASSPDGAGQKYMAALTASNADFTVYQSATANGDGSFTAHACTAWGYCSPFQISTGIACPTNYSSNGSQCTLNAGAVIPKPVMHQMTIVRTGNTFAVDPQINVQDITSEINAKVSGSTISLHGKDGSTTLVTANIDDATVTVTSESPSDNNTTTRSTTQFSAPDPQSGDVHVIGKKTETIQGQGALAGSSSSSASSTDVSSLNKEATQKQIQANQCGQDLQHPCHLSADGETSAFTDLDSQKADYDSKYAAAKAGLEDYSGTPSWGDYVSPLPAAQSCTALTPVFLGHIINYDLCPYQPKIKQIAGYFLYILTAAMLFSIFLSSRKA